MVYIYLCKVAAAKLTISYFLTTHKVQFKKKVSFPVDQFSGKRAKKCKLKVVFRFVQEQQSVTKYLVIIRFLVVCPS